MDNRESWWSRRGKGAKVALVFASLVVLAVLAGVLTPVIRDALRPSAAELAQTLITSADAQARQKAATDLAARRSPEATKDVVAAADTSVTAQEGLVALRDEYAAVLAAAPSTDYSDKKDSDALAETVDCLAIIGDQTSLEAIGDLVRAPQSSSDILDAKTL